MQGIIGEDYHTGQDILYAIPRSQLNKWISIILAYAQFSVIFFNNCNENNYVVTSKNSSLDLKSTLSC